MTSTRVSEMLTVAAAGFVGAGLVLLGAHLLGAVGGLPSGRSAADVWTQLLAAGLLLLLALTAAVGAVATGRTSRQQWRAVLVGAVGCYLLTAVLPMVLAEAGSSGELPWLTGSAWWPVLRTLATVPLGFLLTCAGLLAAAALPVPDRTPELAHRGDPRPS